MALLVSNTIFARTGTLVPASASLSSQTLMFAYVPPKVLEGVGYHKNGWVLEPNEGYLERPNPGRPAFVLPRR